MAKQKAKYENPRHVEYYKKQNPEWTDEECVAAAEYYNKSRNYQCIEYYERKYPNLSHDEQVLLMNNNIKSKVSPQKIEYWKNKYPNESDEEIKSRYELWQRQHNYQCIEYYERKYPNLSHDEQVNMMNESIKNAGKKISKKVSGSLNGMHSSKTTGLERREISPKCIEFYEKHYPNLSHDEHLKMLEEHFKKVAESLTPEKLSTRIEYYLAKGMNQEEAENALKNRQRTFTLDKCIEKYGEKEGIIKYQNRQKKWHTALINKFKKLNKNKVWQSEWANSLISEICMIMNIKNPELEYMIFSNDKHKYFLYDFKYNNKLIEFNGDYWHCNPLIYDETFINKTNNKTAKEIWDHDNEKIKLAENNGFEILIVWETEYKSKTELVNKCINFLLS